MVAQVTQAFVIQAELAQASIPRAVENLASLRTSKCPGGMALGWAREVRVLQVSSGPKSLAHLIIIPVVPFCPRVGSTLILSLSKILMPALAENRR